MTPNRRRPTTFFLIFPLHLIFASLEVNDQTLETLALVHNTNSWREIQVKMIPDAGLARCGVRVAKIFSKVGIKTSFVEAQVSRHYLFILESHDQLLGTLEEIRFQEEDASVFISVDQELDPEGDLFKAIMKKALKGKNAFFYLSKLRQSSRYLMDYAKNKRLFRPHFFRQFQPLSNPSSFREQLCQPDHSPYRKLSNRLNP